MAFDSKGLDDYVDVAQRIADFRERYPEGSLQPLDPAAPFEIREVHGIDKSGKDFTATFIVYIAAAYRNVDDQRPGIGMAWEVFPGRTPYTLGSELMNAETSAWGRAIIAALASDSKRGVSSREEIRNRAAEQEDAAPARRRSRAAQKPAAATTRARATGPDHERLRNGTVEPTPDTRRAERGPVPPGEDAWSGQPAGKLPRPGNGLSGVVGMIQQHFKRLEVLDREERLGLTAQLAGWPQGEVITSSNDLSGDEAKRVLDQLAKCRNHEALMALVTHGERPGDGDAG